MFNTKHFGEIEVEADKIINFPGGIMGFPEYNQFLMISEPDDNLFCWIQSVTDGDFALALMDVFTLMPSYAPTISDDDIEELSLKCPEDYILLNVTVIPSDIKEMTVNLCAPIIINTKNKIGKQVFCENDEYGVRHNVLEISKTKAGD